MLYASIGGMDHDVIEVAEHSLVVTSEQVLNQNGKCSGFIVWSDGTSSQFVGELGRLGDHGRVICKVNGITTGSVLNEQRQLLKLFPETKSEDLQIEVFNPDG